MYLNRHDLHQNYTVTHLTTTNLKYRLRYNSENPSG